MEITVQKGIFEIKIEPITAEMTFGGNPIPTSCKFAVSISPGRMKFQETRNRQDIYYVTDYSSAISQYEELLRYANSQ